MKDCNMYTADMARTQRKNDLDDRIKAAVEEEFMANGAYMRVYIDDPWLSNIETELKIRGFKNIDIPNITLSGDVYFEW